MPVITGLEFNKAKTRVRLYVDGDYLMSLKPEIATENQLKTGDILGRNQIAELQLSQQQSDCFASACRLLNYRPRSEAELKSRLQIKGFTLEIVDASVSRLKNSGLIDDAAFAGFWVENRKSFKPQSAALTRKELKNKGVSQPVIDQALGKHDDFENAWLATGRIEKRLSELDYDTFFRRLGSFLNRRGFSYGTIRMVIAKKWQETNNPG